MDHLNENIKFLRKYKGMTQAGFASELDIKRSSIGAYEEGRARPNLDVQLKMSKMFGISLDDMIRKQIRNNVHLIGSRNDNKSEKAARVLAVTVDDTGRENIELVTEKASAGYLSGYADTEYVRELKRFRLPFMPQGTYRAFEISGDSMLPVQPGTIIVGEYVEDVTRIRDGHTYIVLLEQDGIVFKRVFSQIEKNETLVMQSDNPSYPPYTIKAEDVIEMWEAKVSISKLMAAQDHSVDQLMNMVKGLQHEISELKQDRRPWSSEEDSSPHRTEN